MAKLKESIKECKGKCSFCLSGEVSYGITELQDNSIGYEIMCNKCGATGFEWYNLKYDETFMTK